MKDDLYIGQIFGKWVIQENAKIVKGISAYLCKCTCGYFKYVARIKLIKGKSKGCEKCARDAARKPLPIGSKFGKWTVIEDMGIINKYRNLLYKCECECGHTQDIPGSRLRNGQTTQCKSCSSKIKSIKSKYICSINSKGTLYCISNGDFIKIGWTKRPLKERISDFTVGNPLPIILIWEREGEGHLEEAWHKKLACMGLHQRGEWFKKPEDMSIIDAL